MPNEVKIEMLVEGGKATTTPAIAQQLGPLKMNIGNVMAEVNKKTAPFQGMKVPVKLRVNPVDKSFDITVGSPPVTELIKKELTLEKGSGMPDKEKIGNIAVEQVIKIAMMKMEGMLVNSLKAGVKSVAGSCSSLGLLIEGKTGAEFNRDVEAGLYDEEISAEKTDVSTEKLEMLKVQLAEVQERLRKELEKKKAAEEAAKAVAPVPGAPKPEEKAAEEAAAAEKGKEEKAKEGREGKEAKPAKAEKDKEAKKK